MKTLHDLPRFDDRWSYLYLERGILEQEAGGLILHNASGDTLLPIDQLERFASVCSGGHLTE